MEIVSPRAEMWLQTNIKSHIVRCAKVCYRSEREVDVDKFIEARLRAGHVSILRHGTKYYKIPIPKRNDSSFAVFAENYSFMETIKYAHMAEDNNNLCVAINMQTYERYKYFFDSIDMFEIEEIEAYEENIIWEHLYRYTFYLQTQISTTRELNRVSPNNILEESTRYVEQGVLCRPWWCDDFYVGNDITLTRLRDKYFRSCECAFEDYNELTILGLNREDARGVLPLDNCTHVVYTYTIDEWRDIINKRFFGTTGKPHGNAMEIIGKVKILLEHEGYNFK